MGSDNQYPSESPDPDNPTGPPAMEAGTGIGGAPTEPFPLDAPAPTESVPTESVKRGGPRLLAIIGAVVVVIGGIGFAATKVLAKESGSPTAVGAVEALVESIEADDALGIYAAIDPAEREAWLDPWVGLGVELERFDTRADDDKDDDPLADEHLPTIELIEPLGFDSVEVLTGETNLSRVRLTEGKIEFHADAELVEYLLEEQPDLVGLLDVEPIDLEIEFSEAGSEVSGTYEFSTSDHLYLAAVDRGNGYYVSFAYTLAEILRDAADAEAPDLSGRLEIVGADTPTEAVEQAFEAALGLDVEALIGSLDPVEFAVLRDYWSLYGDALVDQMDDVMSEARESGMSWRLESLKTAAVSANGGTVVDVTELELGFSLDHLGNQVEGKFKLTSDGFTLDIKGESNSETIEIHVGFDANDSTFTFSVFDGFDELRVNVSVNNDGIEISGVVPDGTIDGGFDFDAVAGSFVVDSADFPLAGEMEVIDDCLVITLDGSEMVRECSDLADEFEAAIRDLQEDMEGYKGFDVPLPRIVVVEREVDGQSGWFVSGGPTIIDWFTYQLSLVDSE